MFEKIVLAIWLFSGLVAVIPMTGVFLLEQRKNKFSFVRLHRVLEGFWNILGVLFVLGALVELFITIWNRTR